MAAPAPQIILPAAQVWHTSLPLWAVAGPLLAGLLLYLVRAENSPARKGLAAAVSLAALAAVIRLYPFARGTAEYRLERFMHLGLYFRVDPVGWIFAFLIAFIWLLAVIFSWSYMDHEHNRRRFYACLIFTLGATLGVVLAGDFFTLFLFFELMTFSSYLLVIHEQDRPSMQAGALYLYLGVAGGLALLFAVMLTYAAAGSTEMTALLDHLGASKTLIFVLYLVGFGIKAGVVPLHIWLPLAHPVAPSPASALLSGLMIKAGAYGILRVLLVLYFGPGEGGQHHAGPLWRGLASAAAAAFRAAPVAAAPPAGGGYTPAPAGLDYTALLGYALMWLGIATMLSGAVMALLQTNAKRILAYSSVSQMGYIITGLGTAAYLGVEGGFGFTGAVYHVINHAFFKAGLFMIVGAVYMLTHELELPRLGGMARKMPLAAAAFLVAACGIAGIPGFNGYASKTLIHDGLLEAYHHYHGVSVYVMERLFVITSALTVCYFTKLFRGIFLGPVPDALERRYRLPLSAQCVLGTFAAVIIAVGVRPNLVLDRLLYPAAAGLGFGGHAMEHLSHFDFWDYHPLQAMGVVLLLAIAIYAVGAYRRWFDWEPPPWLSVQYLFYRPVIAAALYLSCRGGSGLDGLVNLLYDRSGRAARRVCRYIGDFDYLLDRFYERSGQTARGLAGGSARLDQAVDEAYSRTGRFAKGLVDGTARLDQAVDEAYSRTGHLAKGLVDGTARLDQAVDSGIDTTTRLGMELVRGSQKLDQALDRACEEAGEAARRAVAEAPGLARRATEKAEESGTEPGRRLNLSRWSLQNLNFDSLLLVAALAIVLLIVFFWNK